MAIDIRVFFLTSGIWNIAKEYKVSLILIGSQGMGIMKRLFLGSTVFDLVRISDLPVMVKKYVKREGKIVNASTNKFLKALIACDFS